MEVPVKRTLRFHHLQRVQALARLAHLRTHGSVGTGRDRDAALPMPKSFECDHPTWIRAGSRRQLQHLGFERLGQQRDCSVHALMLLLAADAAGTG